MILSIPDALNKSMSVNLPSQGLLKVSGPDAEKLLQGQLTCDVTKTPCLGAHCNPQGRVISLFWLFTEGCDFYLKMPKTLLPIALKALQKYAVFFKVSLEINDSLEASGSDEEWKLFNIVSNIPTIYPESSEKFLPHDLNLPELGGVSFDKGCYTGQEIIARMQYKAKLKNHLTHTRIQSENTPVIGEDNVVDFVQIDYNTYEVLMIGANHG